MPSRTEVLKDWTERRQETQGVAVYDILAKSSRMQQNQQDDDDAKDAADDLPLAGLQAAFQAATEDLVQFNLVLLLVCEQCCNIHFVYSTQHLRITKSIISVNSNHRKSEMDLCGCDVTYIDLGGSSIVRLFGA